MRELEARRGSSCPLPQRAGAGRGGGCVVAEEAIAGSAGGARWMVLRERGVMCCVSSVRSLAACMRVLERVSPLRQSFKGQTLT